MLNLYDSISFPNAEIRDNLRNKYPDISELRQISISLSEKYNGKQVPCEFLDYSTTVKTWVNEYNYSIFILNIPLFQMLDAYQKIVYDDTKKEESLYNLFLFNYYCELLAYYLDCAFKKSVNIFNSMFELRVNDENNNFKQILKRIKEESKENIFINKVNKRLRIFNKNNNYKNIIHIRNKNTHSIRSSQSGFLDWYDPKKGVTYGTISKTIKPDEIIIAILESIKLIGEYTVFVEGIIEEYYDYLYEEYKRKISD